MGDRVLVDVNALAIYLVEDHPGHPYIEKELEPGLEGKRELLIFDYLPLRVHWVLTSKWRLPEAATRQAISSFLEQPVTMISGDAETIKETYRIAEEKRHDVFDCFYIALARRALVARERYQDALTQGRGLEKRKGLSDGDSRWCMLTPVGDEGQGPSTNAAP